MLCESLCADFLFGVIVSMKNFHYVQRRSINSQKDDALIQIVIGVATAMGSFVAVKVGLSGNKNRVEKIEKKTDLIPAMKATIDKMKSKLHSRHSVNRLR